MSPSTPAAGPAERNPTDHVLAAARALGGHLPPLLVAAERVAATVTQGLHGRRRVGQGDSFWQFRPLLSGESTARVDWRRSARSEQGHFVRQTEWEAAQTVVLWRGAGPSMNWRSLPALPRKSERAELLLLALASLMLRGGERVRLAGLGATADATSLASLPRLAALLGEQSAGDAAPDLGRVPRRAGVALIGDWLEAPEVIRSLIGGLAEREVTGHVMQVLDPAEVELPYAGRVRFQGAGDGAPSALVGRVEGVRVAYAGRLAQHQAQLAALSHGAGLTFSVHRTDAPAVVALLGLYAALATRGGGR